MFRPIFDRLKNAVATAKLFIKGEAPPPKREKKQRAEFFQGGRIVGKPDSRAPANFHVVMERQSFDQKTNWLVGYNCKHHPKGIEEGKGLSHYRVRENA